MPGADMKTRFLASARESIERARQPACNRQAELEDARYHLVGALVSDGNASPEALERMAGIIVTIIQDLR